MLACLALGAEAVQIGSRFVASAESSAHPAFKQKVLETGPDGTMLAMKALTPVRLIKNEFYQQVADMEQQGASPAQLAAHLGRGRARAGMFEGDLDRGELEIGQIAGSIDRIFPAAEIVERIIAEYQQLQTQIGRGAGRFGGMASF